MWLRSTYNVHRLPPTIQTLMWDYGALDHKQEEQYVKVKMRMMSSMFKDTEWVLCVCVCMCVCVCVCVCVCEREREREYYF